MTKGPKILLYFYSLYEEALGKLHQFLTFTQSQFFLEAKAKKPLHETLETGSADRHTVYVITEIHLLPVFVI